MPDVGETALTISNTKRTNSNAFIQALKYVLTFVSSRNKITEEKLKQLIEEGTEVGILNKVEEKIINKVFRAGDKNAKALMTPRKDIIWINSDDDLGKVWEIVSKSEFSYFPVANGSIDKIIGVISFKDIACLMLQGKSRITAAYIKQPLIIPGTIQALSIIEKFKQANTHFAIVIDEYGGLDGIITTHDIMEALVGELRDGNEQRDSLILEKGDSVYVVDASIDMDDLNEFLSIKENRPKEKNGKEKAGYHSLGGMIMGRLGHVPKKGESFQYNNYIIEVEEMIGNRIDKVSVIKRVNE